MADTQQPDDEDGLSSGGDEIEFELDLDALTLDEPGLDELEAPLDEGGAQDAEDVALAEISGIDELVLDDDSDEAKAIATEPRTSAQEQVDAPDILPEEMAVVFDEEEESGVFEEEEEEAGASEATPTVAVPSQLNEDSESVMETEIEPEAAPVEVGSDEFYDDDFVERATEEEAPVSEAAPPAAADAIADAEEEIELDDEAGSELAQGAADELSDDDVMERIFEEDETVSEAAQQAMEDAIAGAEEEIEREDETVDGLADAEAEIPFDDEMEAESEDAAESEKQEVEADAFVEDSAAEVIASTNVGNDEAFSVDDLELDDEDEEVETFEPEEAFVELEDDVEDDSEDVYKDDTEVVSEAASAADVSTSDEIAPVYDEDEIVAYEFQDDGDTEALTSSEAAAKSVDPGDARADGGILAAKGAGAVAAAAVAGAKKLSTVEKISLAAIALLCIIGVIIFRHSVATGLPPYEGVVIQDSVPGAIKGAVVEIADISAYWRDKRADDRVDPESVALPALKVRVGAGNGYLQVLFRDDEGSLKGDSITCKVTNGRFDVSGTEEIEMLGTVGFINQFYFAEYRSIDNRSFWQVTLRESADNENWTELATFHMPVDYRAD